MTDDAFAVFVEAVALDDLGQPVGGALRVEISAPWAAVACGHGVSVSRALTALATGLHTSAQPTARHATTGAPLRPATPPAIDRAARHQGLAVAASYRVAVTVTVVSMRP